MPADPWSRLDQVLRAWAEAGRAADFWLRDDDAVEPSPALDRLLALTERHGIPLALAVVPAPAGAPLAERVAPAPQATIVLHGWAHDNHALAGEKKQEFGPHRPHEVMLAELAGGRMRLEELFGARFLPLFVPPWNRIDPDLVRRLPEAGLRYLSAFGPEKPSPVRTVNTNVDIIDWHGARGGRDTEALIAEILRQLDRGTAVGILTHHLVHDAVAWDFMERLFEITAGSPACRWRSAGELVSGS